MCATNAGIRIASKLYHREHIITVDRNSMQGLLHLLNTERISIKGKKCHFPFTIVLTLYNHIWCSIHLCAFLLTACGNGRKKRMMPSCWELAAELAANICLTNDSVAS